MYVKINTTRFKQLKYKIIKRGYKHVVVLHHRWVVWIDLLGARFFFNQCRWFDLLRIDSMSPRSDCQFFSIQASRTGPCISNWQYITGIPCKTLRVRVLESSEIRSNFSIKLTWKLSCGTEYVCYLSFENIFKRLCTFVRSFTNRISVTKVGPSIRFWGFIGCRLCSCFRRTTIRMVFCFQNRQMLTTM